jgi:2-methylcitrate dehydratase PrpD
MIDSSPTRALAAFAAGLRPDAIPQPVQWKARQLFADYVCTTAAAVREEPARALQRFATAMGGSGAGILGTTLRVAPPWAALVNGAMGHMAEMDDTHRGTMSHPGDSLWAVALALAGEETPAETFLTAAIAGYEVALRIGEAMMPDHYRRGWHTSGTIMAFGAAATASVLMGLDARRTAWALGTAAAQASGNFAHLTERAMTKDFNCGHAAKCGVVAALLAKEGFSGPTDALENPKGFMKLYGGEVFPDRLTAGLGQTWRVNDVAHKPYSACRHIHASLDALQAILTESLLGSSEVARVTARIFATGAAFVNDPEPWTAGKGLQGARFSAQLNLAVLLTRGQQGLGEMMDSGYTQAALHSPEIRSVMERIEVIADQELEANFPDQWSSRVIVEDRAGHRHEMRVDYPLGEPESPMSSEQLRAKFHKLTALAGWTPERARRVWDAIAVPGHGLQLPTVLSAIYFQE